MKINIKKLYKDAIIPTRGSEHAAGYDLYAYENVHISDGTTQKVKTGIALEIPEGYFGAIFARSGLATKHGLRPANCVGVIDSDYRGEIIVALHNDNDSIFSNGGFAFAPFKDIKAGERVAQIVFLPYLSVDFNEVDELSDTARGDGGFGSTDIAGATVSETSTTMENVTVENPVTITKDKENAAPQNSLLKPEFINKKTKM